VPQVRTLVPARGPSGKPAGEVTELALSPCSPQVAVGHSDGTVRKIPHKLVKSIPHATA
jgi:hypothetical protein